MAPVTVTDREGKYVDGLGESDFLVYDSGRLRPAKVDVSFVPISLVIAVQTSAVSEEAVNKVRKIASLIEPLVTGERGEAALIAFDEEVRVLQPFTSDSARLGEAFQALSARGDGGRLIDAVEESARLLATRPAERRRVLLIVSESKDRGSRSKIEDIIDLAQRENIAIYTVTYSPYLTPFTAKPGTIAPGAPLDLIGVFREIGRLGKKNAAEALARYTGGTRLGFLRQRSLERAIARIGEELHSQYLVSFAAPAAAPEFHPIAIRIRNRPELQVRARPGYWSATP
jgi:VWFA-related protein